MTIDYAICPIEKRELAGVKPVESYFRDSDYKSI